MAYNIHEYVKSPLNYTGRKYKLLPHIIPLIPKETWTFVDVFGGGFDVGINSGVKNIYYNDKNTQVVELLDYLYNSDIEVLFSLIEKSIDEYNLNKENTEAYIELRDSYNSDPTPLKFYLLIIHSFSNYIRFNRKGKFNIPFGKRTFNANSRENLSKFMDEMRKHTIKFTNMDFRDYESVIRQTPTDTTLLYFDPPYLNSTAAYNERNGWNENDERDLLRMIKSLAEDGYSFLLSNNLSYKNTILESWVKENGYPLHYLEYDYVNCNYQKKDKKKNAREILTGNTKQLANVVEKASFFPNAS